MRLSLAAAIGSAVLLSGCGHSPAATFLTIDQAPPTVPAASYRGPPLRVPFFHVPVTLDRPEYAAQQQAGNLKVDDFARWAAPLGRLARDTFIQDLTLRLPSGSVQPPDAPAGKAETVVEATVLDFANDGALATMTVSYRIGAASQPMLAQFRAPLADTTPTGTARAWSALIGQLADRVVADIRKR